MCAPPDAEQRSIAAFLDRETARVDALIAKVRDAIDRLKELRAALISAAVTGKIDVREEAMACAGGRLGRPPARAREHARGERAPGAPGGGRGGGGWRAARAAAGRPISKIHQSERQERID